MLLSQNTHGLQAHQAQQAQQVQQVHQAQVKNKLNIRAQPHTTAIRRTDLHQDQSCAQHEVVTSETDATSAINSTKATTQAATNANTKNTTNATTNHVDDEDACEDACHGAGFDGKAEDEQEEESSDSEDSQSQGARSIAGAVVAHAFRIGTQMVRTSAAQQADRMSLQYGVTDPVALACSDVEHCLSQLTPLTSHVCDDANRRALLGARQLAKHVVHRAKQVAETTQTAAHAAHAAHTSRKSSALRQAVASSLLAAAKATSKALEDFDLNEVHQQAARQADKEAVMRRAVLLECEKRLSTHYYNQGKRQPSCCSNLIHQLYTLANSAKRVIRSFCTC